MLSDSVASSKAPYTLPLLSDGDSRPAKPGGASLWAKPGGASLWAKPGGASLSPGDENAMPQGK